MLIIGIKSFKFVYRGNFVKLRLLKLFIYVKTRKNGKKITRNLIKIRDNFFFFFTRNKMGFGEIEYLCLVLALIASSVGRFRCGGNIAFNWV